MAGRRRALAACCWVIVLAAGCSSGSGAEDSKADRDGQDGGTGNPSTPCGGEGDSSALRIVTESGVVVGTSADGTDAFLGIPYAAPVVGEGRFAAPKPFGCFEGDFMAQSLGPRCPQLDSDESTVIGEEDCLQLNVWTPKDRADSLPVLFFIHGGGNAVGSATDPLYDGRHLAARGAVVVTLNYRLGALGYLLQTGVPTNLATRDQLAALSWVQRNIAAFGGDPSHVTVFGESAGAVNTCALLGVPAAEGLLHRAIVQSGSCHYRDQPTYREQMGALTENVGCAEAADVLTCLRSLKAEDLVRAEPTGYPNVAGLSVSWGPHVDGELLPKSTDAQFAAGESLRVPVIVGSNRDETANSVMAGLSRSQFENLVRISFPGYGAAVLAQYPESEFPDGTEAYVRLSTEAKFQCGARRYARMAAAGGLDSFLYMYAYDGFTSPVREARAFHGIELPFLFGTFDAIPIGARGYSPNPSDLQMSETLQARWLAFAVNGVPETEAPPWPTADDGYLTLDVPTVVGSDEYPSARCDFWDGLLDRLP